MSALLTIYSVSLNDFGAYSGPKIDISKTEMRNVAWEPKIPLIGKLATFHIACPEEYAFALGVTFGYDSTTTRHKIQEKLVTLKKVLNYWRTRNLTLIRRICMVKTLAISKLVYNTSVLRPCLYVARSSNIIRTNLIQGPASN